MNNDDWMRNKIEQGTMDSGADEQRWQHQLKLESTREDVGIEIT